ncbi:DNA-directed RNA polymerase subunit K [Candidatus Pacearchaeota archaeon CG10_big_fil_rev_8_21_14_0_10_31_24]|nr:MAG: DNA-directed RNA polymerase subunit K [Candidatus Pacearchaeota archaeon CG10_big_fil_rev_8_21_14_0_10_31_24]
MKTQFSKYETARIIGARALQIAMDAPLLIKISDAELKDMRYDSIKIAEKELASGALPISIHRPLPQRKKDKLTAVKEEKYSDEELAAKEQEVEKEIAEAAEELGLVEEDESEVAANSTEEI